MRWGTSTAQPLQAVLPAGALPSVVLLTSLPFKVVNTTVPANSMNGLFVDGHSRPPDAAEPAGTPSASNSVSTATCPVLLLCFAKHNARKRHSERKFYERGDMGLHCRGWVAFRTPWMPGCFRVCCRQVLPHATALLPSCRRWLLPRRRRRFSPAARLPATRMSWHPDPNIYRLSLYFNVLSHSLIRQTPWQAVCSPALVCRQWPLSCRTLQTGRLPVSPL